MLVFVGDINLTDWYFNVGFGIGTRISNGFNPFHRLERNPEDLWIGNFEGVASDVTDKNGFAGEVFRVQPDALKRLNHFGAYGLANNHAMQHGEDAYQRTSNAIRSYGSICFGSNTHKSAIVEHQGRIVSLTGMSLRIDEFTRTPSYWHNPEYCAIKSELCSLPKDAFKVLYIHWGNEFINRPSTEQKKFAHWLVDAGFDLIIGMHPHVLQGYEVYKGKYIFYSLGNFVFEMAWSPTKFGALVRYDLEAECPEVKYVRIEKDCAPMVVDESVIPPEWRFAHLNEALQLDDNSEAYYAEIMRNCIVYRRENHKYIMRNMMRHPSLGICLLKDFAERRILRKE